MSNYPNYRISVELVFFHKGKVLLTKRSEEAEVAPGVWNVPAGKVKYDEIPVEAAYREAIEETNLEIDILKEIGVRNQIGKSTKEEIYRVIFTYLVKAKNDDYRHFQINEEHTAFHWVNGEELWNTEYDSLYGELKQIMTEKVFNKEGSAMNGWS